MYRFLIYFLLISLFSPCVYASRTVVTRNPYYNAYNNPYAYRQYNNRNIHPYSYPNTYQYRGVYNPNFTELSALEKYALNKNYTKDSNLARLQRLEMQAFGAIQQGDFDSRYENVRSAILSRPKAHTNSTVWKNIGDYFAGQMTGFTPPIDQYTGYSYNNPVYFSPSNYGNTSVTEYSSPFGGHGTRIRNYGTSSGTGITILD